MNGFDKPNYTQVPNVFLDDMIAEMGEAELRVALVIMRETFGWHRESKQMSLTYLQNATGMSRQGVINGINAGLERGIFNRTPVGFGRHDIDQGPHTWEYSLVINRDSDDQPSQRSRPGVVNEVDQPSQRSRPGVVNEVDTTKKDKESLKEIDDDASAVFSYLDTNGAVLTSILSERYHDLINEYGADVVLGGMRRAKERGKLGVYKYVLDCVNTEQASRKTGKATKTFTQEEEAFLKEMGW